MFLFLFETELNYLLVFVKVFLMLYDVHFKWLNENYLEYANFFMQLIDD